MTPEDPLRPLLDRIGRTLPEPRASLVAALALAGHRLTPPNRLAALDLDEAVRALAEALSLIRKRPAGEIGLRAGAAPGEGTVVEAHARDTPFLLSTIKAELDEIGLDAVDDLHPVFGVRRGADGQLLEIVPARGAAHRETYLRLRLPQRLGESERADVVRRLSAVLHDVRRATGDFGRMRAQLNEILYETRASAGSRFDLAEVDEVIDLLTWLRQDRFILLGMCAYEPSGAGLRLRAGSGLGILDGAAGEAGAGADETGEDGAERLCAVSRTVRCSPVHQRVPMVDVRIKRVQDGAATGEFRLLGLYAQKALAEPSSTIPVLRRKLASIVEAADLVAHSHDERALRVLFDSFPKHELFECGARELGRILSELLDTSRRHEPRVLLRPESARGHVSVLVVVPQERLSAAALDRIRELVARRLGGTDGAYRLRVTEWRTALLHFRVRLGGAAPSQSSAAAAAALEREVAAVVRTFSDDLEQALAAAPEAARRAARRWAASLPAGYTDRTDPQTAIEDLAALERLDAGGVVMALRPDRTGAAGVRRFRLYRPGPSVEPSRVLPLLESLGLPVLEEVPHRLSRTPLGEVHIHDYAVRVEGALDEADADRVCRAASALMGGRARADSLNRLVLAAGLEWEDVVVLRAYLRYRRQVGTSYTEAYANDALVEHPQVARALLGYFNARLAPAPDAGERAAREAVEDALRAVERLDQDRIMRRVLNLIDATVRTNRWRPPPRSEALALKLDSAAVVDMPKPVPHVEIFVFAPEVEGVHLRGGPVARGGLRWSERADDYRTEVLGLMKAQMTKNAVIVPTGAKGGFVLKRTRCGLSARSVEADLRRGYEVFVRALLDVTDRIADGRVLAPDGVRSRDGEDPYLVVAADRGTATFSDLANEISRQYGFWLGDAFASGGSHGYDHKAMGITARGAWIAVRRHFRELDMDVDTDPITVVGVGDMSGDVFGNGLLRSRRVALVAAFDHRDIFIDPDPDPEAAFDERLRLFRLASSSWQDYDRALISDGGGVWPRTAKRIPLAAPVRVLLGVADDSLPPPELISALLGARVDLLYFGGVGTFVKAADEAHAQVGDRANDEVRVDADRLRARVVAEGANLGVTQRGRIQYARRGGRCNTDAVDNSAGVGCSDREVNLKILLAAAMEAGRIAADERDRLLRAMQDEVGEAALRDVYLQTWAISQELAFSPGGIGAYERLMAALTASGRLDRAVETLPDAEELARRAAAGAGLARPEIAVLLGHAKAALAAELAAGPFVEQPYVQRTLRGCFPSAAVERFGDLLAAHPLRRELIATAAANDVLNRMGVTWAHRTALELGCHEHEVAAAYWAAREVADADARYRAVERLDGHLEPLAQLRLKGEVDRLLDAYARTYLRHGDAADIAATVARDRPAFRELEQARLGPGGEPESARRIAVLADLHIVPDIAAAARVSGRAVARVREVFVGLGAALPLDLLRRHLSGLTPHGRWERWQHRGLYDELADLGRATAIRAIAEHPDARAEEVVSAFLNARAAPRARIDAVTRMLDDVPSLHAVAVAVRTLHDLL